MQEKMKLKAVMEKIKRRSRKAALIVSDTKQSISDTSEAIQNVTDDPHSSSSEYATDKLERSTETVAREAGHLVVDTTKYAFRTGKKAIQERHKQNHHPESEPVDYPPDTTEKPQYESLTPRAQSATAPKTPDAPKTSPSPQVGTVKATEKASSKATVKTAERSVKTAQHSIKTAEKTSAAAAKTAEESAKAAERTVEATAKAAVRAKHILEAAAAETAAGIKAAAEATVKAVKAIVAGIKELVAAIATGGWVTVVIIIVILLVALILGSAFGIFFSSEDTGSSMTMQSAVLEINREYTAKIDAIKDRVQYDELETDGTQAEWPQVLAVYAVMLNADPDNPTEVVTMDNDKKAILADIFWDMNEISYSTSSETEMVPMEVPDEEGNLQRVEVPVTTVTLHIQTSGKTAEEMAEEYAFTDEQKEWLTELLKPEYQSMWAGALYGIHNADGQIVAVALSQVGNVGGRPYWSWYGFSSRVAWCACFVSWCADQCGYIEAGVIPKFAGCGIGADWFIQRGQWADRNYVPQPGDIIFFDWASDGQNGSRDHVGLVEKCENGYVYTVEGNITDSCVRRRYPVGWYEIVGYGLPVYP